MSADFHAIVWIDHHEAHVFRFNAKEVGRLVVHADRTTQHSGQVADKDDFRERVVNAISDAAVIVITGPANPKGELMKHIREHAPSLLQKVVTVEIVSEPSDVKIAHHGRPHDGA
jgi:stalled ribosome rescue protein Dom34